MPSWIDRINRARLRKTQPKAEPASDSGPSSAPVSPPSVEDTLIGSRREGINYLKTVSDKMMKLAEDFAAGHVNRVQFEELYRHYVKERAAVEKMMQSRPASPAWKGVVTAGESMMIKRKHAAQPLGYAIYLNANNMPLRNVGDVRVDSGLLASTLSSYRSATSEMFRSGLHSVEVESGRWVCFAPGMYTTLLVLFTAEPAHLQMEMLEQLHSHFERANQPTLEAGILDASKLVYPHAAAFE